MPAPDRSEMLRLLTEACELEHGLACSYLYAALSIKQDLSEGGLDQRQLQQAKLWASQIYFVASQEMLHLAQAWNLLTAIGGTPYYLRPNFPQMASYYPLHARLSLEPFGVAALRRFLVYEKPMTTKPEHAFVEELASRRTSESGVSYRTIGELYARIAEGFVARRDIVIGDERLQPGARIVDFPDIVQVVDTVSALRAIERITHQGEGTETDRTDCHFGIFAGILGAYERERVDSGDSFQPARSALTNPAAEPLASYAAPEANALTDPRTRTVAELFDGLYSLMLRMLGHAFTGSGDEAERRIFSTAALLAMTTVIKPLGEALMLLPAGPEYGDARGGPAFGLTRHVVLPHESRAARVVAIERATTLTERLSVQAGTSGVPARVMYAVRALERVRATLVG